jgi:hypothetical protein
MKATNVRIADHFTLFEVMPRTYCQQFDNDTLLAWISPTILKAADRFRDIVGKPVTVNNWNEGGTLNLCGLRPPNTSIGAPKSAHKVLFDSKRRLTQMGQALDLHVAGLSGEAMRQVIRENWPQFRGLITRVEDKTDGWLHIDCKRTDDPSQLVVFGFFKG